MVTLDRYFQFMVRAEDAEAVMYRSDFRKIPPNEDPTSDNIRWHGDPVALLEGYSATDPPPYGVLFVRPGAGVQWSVLGSCTANDVEDTLATSQSERDTRRFGRRGGGASSYDSPPCCDF